MNEPFTRLPDKVCFALPELALILETLDHAVEDATKATRLRIFRRAQVVMWRKLWPELADLYEDEVTEEEE